MQKINVAIVGYGNLGKSLETLLLKDERYNLVCIFSRRKILAKVPVEPLANLQNYKEKVDFLFMCGGSKSDIENQVLSFCKDFNTIDSFDNHNHIKLYLENLNKKCKSYKHVAVCCVGWDPGIFSLMRILFDSIQGNAYTFWGKGISQGHSQAIRNIEGVNDAIQYTLPNKKIIKQIKSGILPNKDSKSFHNRYCLVVANKNMSKIKQSIINMPDYFEGYKTTVKFVDQQTLDKHKNLFHAGEVITLNDVMNFKLKLDSNPNFTAKVMASYGIALQSLINSKKYGAYSILDIAPKYLNMKEYIKYI